MAMIPMYPLIFLGTIAILYVVHKYLWGVTVSEVEPFVSSKIYSFLKILGGGWWRLALDLLIIFYVFDETELFNLLHGDDLTQELLNASFFGLFFAIPSGVITLVFNFWLAGRFKSLGYSDASGAAWDISFGAFWIFLFVPIILYLIYFIFSYGIFKARSQKDRKEDARKDAEAALKDVLDL